MTGLTQAHRWTLIDERRNLLGQIGRFMGIGAASMLLNLMVFASLDRPLGHQGANVVALVVGGVVNTAVNRRYTFQVRGQEGHAKVQLQNLALLAITWLFTAIALVVLQRLEPQSTTWTAMVTIVIATFLAMIVRFVLLRRWFAPQMTGSNGVTPHTL
ncbi:GtrA family protein [Leekyejoonella antrihumi]|uniref:GtrA family protein n=1 Tax=Leekyejoonella antrihumi TaxID=1660198 RepID=A0A563E608_9MICO|nr:GtrA family protein [Leekyejoonella antrihumi]TWP37998.1 GtrA family protein [Leekyejoonella antrihumi]